MTPDDQTVVIHLSTVLHRSPLLHGPSMALQVAYAEVALLALASTAAERPVTLADIGQAIGRYVAKVEAKVPPATPADREELPNTPTREAVPNAEPANGR